MQVYYKICIFRSLRFSYIFPKHYPILFNILSWELSYASIDFIHFILDNKGTGTCFQHAVSNSFKLWSTCKLCIYSTHWYMQNSERTFKFFDSIQCKIFYQRRSQWKYVRIYFVSNITVSKELMYTKMVRFSFLSGVYMVMICIIW